MITLNRFGFVATALSLLITSTTAAFADGPVHLNPFQGSGSGPDKLTAHDNAYAQADTALRSICRDSAPSGTTGRLENEVEDSTSYTLNFPFPGWNALSLVEADCAFVSNS